MLNDSMEIPRQRACFIPLQPCLSWFLNGLRVVGGMQMKADRDAGSEGLVEQLAARLNTGGMSRFQLELFHPQIWYLKQLRIFPGTSADADQGREGETHTTSTQQQHNPTAPWGLPRSLRRPADQNKPAPQDKRTIKNTLNPCVKWEARLRRVASQQARRNPRTPTKPETNHNEAPDALSRQTIKMLTPLRTTMNT